MRKFKVNRDKDKPVVPSKEKIAQYQDFSKLSHQYDQVTKRPKKPLYKNPKFFIGLVLIVVIAYLLFDSNSKSEEKKEDTNTESSK